MARRAGDRADGRLNAAALDPDRPIPLYVQLKTLLREAIISGLYGPADRLPTEHELCAQLGISRTPVNRALTELAEEGVILRRRRRGTYVNPHWVRPHAERPEVRIVVPEGAWERQIRDAAADDIRASVVTVPLPELHHTVTRAAAEGRGPDLTVLDSVWVHELSAAGFLWPLDELDPAWIGEEYERDFLEPFVTVNRYDGRPVAVQAEADVAGLWYRRDPLAALGLAPPGTWEELLAAGRAARDASGAPALALPGGSRGGETTSYCLLAVLAANGAGVLGPDGVTLDTPATVEALAFLRRLIDERIAPPEVVAYEWDRPIRLLADGRAVLAVSGSYEGPRLAAQSRLAMAALWDHYGFAPFPRGPRGAGATLAGGMVYAILRQAQEPGLAMRLLRRLTSPEACARMSRATAQIPPRRSAAELVSAESPFLAATTAMLASAAVRPSIAAYPRVSTQLQAMLEAALTDRLSPAAAAARAADMIGAVTGLAVAHG